jgi:hypothetical protein
LLKRIIRIEKLVHRRSKYEIHRYNP